ncbi:MAG: cohesin domain-containing protein [Candidatus Nealsonbacteria bacterium]|nr:cohesin domain-containing protein [Candidatus Nealsonbacteria bacterium]
MKKQYTILIILILFFLTIVSEAKAAGASLFISPASESFEVGDTFQVSVNLDTGGIPINASQLTVYFPPEQLEILEIAKDNSIFTIWPQEPIFSNQTGKISLAGGVPHPGFSQTGKVVTLKFKAKEKGTVNLSLGEGKVLADDGRGTDILVFIKEARYFIKEHILLPTSATGPQILSTTHPEQEEWYNNGSPSFQWAMPSSILGVSFILNRSPLTWPDLISEGEISAKTYQGLDDGIWYFHLRLKNKEGWLEAAHYKIQVDLSPPSPFEVAIDNKGDSTNPKPNIYFETKDDLSGVSYYKFRIDEGSFLKLALAQISSFSLPLQYPGQHSIAVRAVDKAGNNTETKTVLDIAPIATPEIFIWPRYYISGEEVFYIEGSSLPRAIINIFLKRDSELVKKWRISSDSKGGWAFSTDELLKSGAYYLSAQAEDERGAQSMESASRKIEVSLSGIALGRALVSYKVLVLALFFILILGMIYGALLIYGSRRIKNILRKETKEAEDSVELAFRNLEKEIEKKIEMFDSRPGFSEREKKICQELKKYLNISKESISKEIEDVEKELE